MKNTLLVLCGALAFVGCDQNRGGMGRDSDRDAGSSRDATTYPAANPDSSLNNRNSLTLTNTNSVIVPPVETLPADNTKPYGTEPNTAPKN